MRLPPDQVERFYRIWKPLMLFVNRHRRVVPEMLDRKADDAGKWHVPDVFKIREALWADDALREQFVGENADGLPAADLEIVRSWRHRLAGNFVILRQLKKYAVFLADKESTVYAVLGLTSTFDEVVPFLPCYVQTVLLPWEDKIIYDSLISPYNVTFGGGARSGFTRAYADARERGAIITSLLPSQEPGSAGDRAAGARATSERVLDAFRKHLFASGLSPKVVERDVAQAADFALAYLAAQPEPLSLRDFGPTEVHRYLAGLPAGAGAGKAGAAAVLTGMRMRCRRLMGLLSFAERPKSV